MDKAEDMGEQELDDALEQELAASIHRHAHGSPLFLPAMVATSGAATSTPKSSIANPPSSSLTFEFPGWGVDISRDPKRRSPSIVRHHHHHHHSDFPAHKIFIEDEQGERGKACWGDTGNPGNGRYVYKMPDEIITNVFKRLCIRDLCSSILTCNWWHHLGSRDEVWERFYSRNHLYQQSGTFLTKWGIAKNAALSERMQTRVAFKHAYFCKGFEHLRRALHSWWDNRRPTASYSSKVISGLLYKMTSHDWTLVYEFFGVVFAERADCLAVELLGEIERQAEQSSQSLCPFGCDHASHTLEGESTSSNLDILSILNKEALNLASGGGEDKVPFEGIVGQGIWQHVCGLWKRYRHWLMLVFEHCPDLNREVMVEKARATAWTTTPNIYEKGVICFRGQVLLKYGLRRVLQAGFLWLSLRDANGWASEFEVELLRSIHHLLQEADVRDDTLSPKTFTKTKLWRCFPTKRSSARHISEEMQKKLLDC